MILPESTPWFLEPGTKSSLYDNYEVLSNSQFDNFLILGTDYTLPTRYYTQHKDIFSQKYFFKNIQKYIHKHIDNIKNGKTKLIFFFVDYWGIKNKNEKDDTINSGGLITYDIYTWLYPQLKKLDILKNTIFVTPQSIENILIFDDFNIIECNLAFRMQYLNIDQKIKEYKLYFNTTNYENKFIWLNRRPRNHRIYALYKLIENNLLNNDTKFSFYYYTDEKHDLKEFILNHLTSIINDKPNQDVVDTLINNFLNTQIIDKSFDVDANRQEDIQTISLFNLYKTCWLELISEFNYSDHSILLTEKTARAIVFKKPFIIFGDKYSLKELHRLGFKTFSNCWDESYDSLSNITLRIDKAIDTIKYIFSNYSWQKKYPKDIQNILDYNYNYYIDTFKQQTKIKMNKIFN